MTNITCNMSAGIPVSRPGPEWRNPPQDAASAICACRSQARSSAGMQAGGGALLGLVLLLLLALATPLRAGDDLQLFFFGNDRIAPSSGEGDEAVPFWLARMAEAAGVHLTIDGTSGTPGTFARDLPPRSDWRTEGLARRMSDNPRSFRMAGFDTVILAPGDIGDDTPGLVRRTFDWAGRQGVRRFLLYADGAPLDDLADRLHAALDVPVGVIPAARVLAALDVDSASARDDALLQAMVIWSALFHSTAPTLDLPAASPALRDAYPALAERVHLLTAGAVAPEGATLTPPATSFVDPSLAFGLTGIADWSTEMPFIDVMKTARPWIGHLPGQWGGVSSDDLRAGGFLSPEGWPLAIPAGVESLETLTLTDLPPDATGVAGRYVVRWEGEGQLALSDRAREVTMGDHEAHFSFTPGDGMVGIRLTGIDPADPIRSITMMREDHVDLAQAGARFNPDFLATVQDVRMLRFMDWMATNDSTQRTWDDRPRPEDATWASHGVPVEVMVELANRTGTDPWFTLPHGADDDYVRHFAQYVHDHLAPGLRAHAEWSNEVWNFLFSQARWAEEQGQARWGVERGGDVWVQYAGTRAAEVADIWAEVFADAPDRLVRVVGVQTGWPGLEEPMLYAPLRQAEGLPAPVQSFDAYAVTGYFGYDEDGFIPTLRRWMAAGDATAQLTRALREGSINDMVTRLWPHHAQVAREHGLAFLMYEGGSHLVGGGDLDEDDPVNTFLKNYSYSQEVAGLYAEVLAAWRAIGQEQPTGPFNAYVAIVAPSRWGSWGARRHGTDDNPRRATLAAWNSLPLGTPRDALRHGITVRAGDDGGTLDGTAQADTLIGGAGDDVIVSGGGADLVAGGAGHDRVVLPGTPDDWTPAWEGSVLWMLGPDSTVRMVDIDEVAFSAAPDAVLVVRAP